jgi:hypothetical protein
MCIRCQICIAHFQTNIIKQILLSGNGVDQTANTYNLNARNEVLINTSKLKLK